MLGWPERTSLLALLSLYSRHLVVEGDLPRVVREVRDDSRSIDPTIRSDSIPGGSWADADCAIMRDVCTITAITARSPNANTIRGHTV